MKIAQIIPNLKIAGAEIMVENLVNEQSKLGHEVFIISLYNVETEITNRLKKKGIKIYYCNKKIGFDFSLLGKIRKIIKEEKPDVIHSHLYTLKYVVFSTMFQKRPKIVHTIHTTIKKESRGIERQINKFCYKHLKVVPVALTENIKQELILDYKMKKRAKNIKVVANGIDLSKTTPKLSYESSNGIFKIIHVGRFSSVKNHKSLIEAFNIVNSKYKNTKLILIGDGELKDDVKNQVKLNNLSNDVNFIGITNEVYKYLNESDIFVLPSFWEGLSLSLIEAMATGLPIVASPFGGIPSMVENNKSALIIEPTSKLLSDSIIKLLNSSKLRKCIGLNALEKSKEFSSIKMAGNYIKIYKENKK